jgi:ATP-binding cassette subfamily B protein
MENGSESKIYQSYYKEGIDLSGGEKQRIAIARAIVKNSDLYIFDEPSSALDAIAEEQLYQIINSIPNDKTVIFISHRLASVSSTNRVIMFENGEIIGDGNHDQLIKQCPQYRSLYETQARRYV